MKNARIVQLPLTSRLQPCCEVLEKHVPLLSESSCSSPAAGGASSIWRPDQNPLRIEVGDCLEEELARQGGKAWLQNFTSCKERKRKGKKKQPMQSIEQLFLHSLSRLIDLDTRANFRSDICQHTLVHVIRQGSTDQMEGQSSKALVWDARTSERKDEREKMFVQD